MDNIQVYSITIVTGNGPDKLIVLSDLPDGCWPYTGPASIKIEVAQGRGLEYCKKYFPQTPIKSVC